MSVWLEKGQWSISQRIFGVMVRSLEFVLRSQGSYGWVKQGKDLDFKMSLKGVKEGMQTGSSTNSNNVDEHRIFKEPLTQ